MSAALDLAFGQGRLATGRVVLCDADKLAVALEGSGSRDATARRAPSCLLSPQPGDRVLVGLLPEPYVLAVLERDRTRPAELAFEGDASVKAGGRLALGGDEGVSITSRRGISLLSRLLEVRARDGTLALERLTAVAKAAQAHCEKLGLFVQAYDLVAERVTERAKRIYRFVEEIEQLRARHLDYRAEETAQLRGENTVVAARQVVKVDGEQIHVG